MGVAVCGMHYTGMAATSMVPNGKTVFFGAGAVEPENLGFYIFLASFAVLVTLMLVVQRQRLAAGPLYEA
jgi:NO-binding membrane sensor protein with MHYT domain